MAAQASERVGVVAVIVNTERKKFAKLRLDDGTEVYAPYSSWRQLQDEAAFRRSSAVRFELVWDGEWKARRVRLDRRPDLRRLDRTAVNAALQLRETLPESVASALGNAQVEISPEGCLVVRRGKLADEGRLHDVLHGSGATGWTEWLGGARGWAMACDKQERQRFVDLLGRLQRTYKEAMKRRIKTNPQARELFYQHGHEEDSASRAELWTLGAAGNLKDFVARVRSFLEVLLFYKHDARHRSTDQLSWLPLDRRRVRWDAVTRRASMLMRGSSMGPDVPVQWAGHQPRNKNHLTVVTAKSMTELVLGLAAILRDMFLVSVAGCETLTSLDDVVRFLDDFAAKDDDDPSSSLAAVAL